MHVCPIFQEQQSVEQPAFKPFLLLQATSTDYLSGIAKSAGISEATFLMDNEHILLGGNKSLDEPITGQKFLLCDVPLERQPPKSEVTISFGRSRVQAVLGNFPKKFRKIRQEVRGSNTACAGTCTCTSTFGEIWLLGTLIRR